MSWRTVPILAPQPFIEVFPQHPTLHNTHSRPHALTPRRFTSPLSIYQTTMSSNVGLSTPRGSGTSGFVQRNLSYVRPRAAGAGAPYNPDDFAKHKQRQPDAEILEHERKRRIEVKVFELRDRLEDEGVDEDDIDDRVGEFRKKLEAEDAKNKGRGGTDARGLKGYQVHDLAKAKMEETEKMRKAFKISDNYEEGSHWKRDEKKRQEAAAQEGDGDKDDARR
jgi:hypothetical protein